VRFAMADMRKTRKDAAAKLQETPIWNFLVLAVALVATIDTVIKYTEGGRSRYWPLFWILMFLFVFLLTTNFAQRNLLKRADRKRSEICNYLLLIPSSGDESFYLAWAFLLLNQAKAIGKSIFITAEFADSSFKGNLSNHREQHVLEDLEELKQLGVSHFDGVFAILEEPDNDETRAQMLRYYQLVDSNIVLLDMNMNHVLTRERGYPMMDFVGSNEKMGGEMAALLAFDYFTEVKPINSNPRILILEPHNREFGNEAWDQIRVESFKRKLNDLMGSSVDFESIPDCKYNLEKSIEAIRVHPMDGDHKIADFLMSFDLIFATNDDTALGAYQVLEEELSNDKYKVNDEWSHKNTFKHRGPRIIGYDGSQNFYKTVLSDSNQWLIGTIDVQQEMQAMIALSQMNKLRSMGQLQKSKTYRSANKMLNRIIRSDISKSSLKQSADISNRQSSDYFYNSDENLQGGFDLANGLNINFRKLDRPELVSPRVKISPFLKDPLITRLNVSRQEAFRYSVIAQADVRVR